MGFIKVEILEKEKLKGLQKDQIINQTNQTDYQLKNKHTLKNWNIKNH